MKVTNSGVVGRKVRGGVRKATKVPYSAVADPRLGSLNRKERGGGQGLRAFSRAVGFA